MSGLRLPQLPDRTPVKITIAVSPSLEEKLQAYARLYEQTYGRAEPVVDLIPPMLEGFLDSDRAFKVDWSRRDRS